MANRILVSVNEDTVSPSWIGEVEPFMQKAMKQLKFDGEEVSVLFCGDVFMQTLNRAYRNIDSPTDVLSFENGDSYTDDDGSEWFCAGDIAVSLETLPKNAASFDTDVNTELKRLLVHGLLHLNGYDHGEEHIETGKTPECEMLVLQEKTLADMGGEKIIR